MITVPPRESMPKVPLTSPQQWKIGVATIMVSWGLKWTFPNSTALCQMFRWVAMTPLGQPVVPEVYMRWQVSLPLVPGSSKEDPDSSRKFIKEGYAVFSGTLDRITVVKDLTSDRMASMIGRRASSTSTALERQSFRI